MKNNTIELQDIQGLLIRSYSYLKEATYVMLRITSVDQARKWIDSIRAEITPASEKPDTIALHIAFTNHGIKKLIPAWHLSKKFSREFTEGMVSETRSRTLGDIDTNDPKRWHWNGTDDNSVDVVIMIFAIDKVTLDSKYQTLSNTFQAHDIQLVIKLDALSRTGSNDREHFGFADGISQPRMKSIKDDTKLSGTDKTKHDSIHDIMDGEIILGYLNEYNKMPHTPTIKGDNNDVYDIGKNGSYMVFRQLQQDVMGFWNYMKTEVANNPNLIGKDAVYLASKMIGRWPNGVSLTDAPHQEDPPPQDLNSFLFKKDDAEGLRCPLGAHIRRTNPRDGIDNDVETSITISKRHRVLRRGRSYGAPLDANETNSDAERGLFFICFNANIKRQFEFIQHAWSNNSKFDGLYNDVDPLTGFPYLEDKYVPGEFSIQDCPVRKRVQNIPQFVEVRGGAYFFMPGLTALKIISALRQE